MTRNKRKVKTEVQSEFDIAIKEDTIGMLGSQVFSKKWHLFLNPFKKKWNNVETIIFDPNLGVSVIGINSLGVAVVNKFTKKYPPKTWPYIFMVRPVKKYTKKELYDMHGFIGAYGDTFNDMNPFELALKLVNATGRSLFDNEAKIVTMESFKENENFTTYGFTMSAV